MKILVTGGLGHIGSSIIRYLPNLKDIKTIYVLDNIMSERYTSLFDLPKKGNYKFLNINLATCKISEIPASDIVIHLAAKTDAAQSSKFKKEFYKNNNKSTINIIKYCKKFNSKLIFASSTSVYGPQTKIVSENSSDKNLNPQSPYARIKLNEERLIQKSFKKPNSFLILRLGTIYGFSPGIRFHTAINKFSLQACMEESLTIWKTAFNQKRPYLGLFDLNRAIKHIIKKDLIQNELYNILSHNLKVRDIVKVINEIKKTKKTFVNHPIMNQLSYTISNNKFISTGFDFKSNLKKEISTTINKILNIS